MSLIRKLQCQHKLALGFLLSSFFLTGIAHAEETDIRPYKVSVLIFKHLPADKNTAPALTTLWSDETFAGSTLVTNPPAANPDQPYLSSNQSTYNTLLPTQQSALVGSYRALSKDSHYLILYNGAWLTQFEYGKPSVFHLHQAFDNNANALDSLIEITMKFYFDVHFQTQLLTPSTDSFYHIDALDETYQTPSNQLQYIDGPIYGALILITRYDGK